jgi:hypothetical protein
MSDPLKELIVLNSKQFVTFVCIAFIALQFVAFAVYQIINSYSAYKTSRRNMELAYKPASSDNYDMVKSVDQSNSRYRDDTTFTTNMQKSLAEYKSYNERLKQYYKENRPDQVPKDLIDHSIFNPKADKY